MALNDATLIHLGLLLLLLFYSIHITLSESVDNYENLPGLVMEYKVYVAPAKEDCYYQKVAAGTQLYVSCQVLRGGDGMVGFAVRNPENAIVRPYKWEASGEYEEKSTQEGSYSVCIDNQFSRFAGKLVNLYITTFRYDEWERFSADIEDADHSIGNLTQSLSFVDKQVHEMRQYQSHTKARGSRDYEVLLSNQSYVQTWSILQCVVIVLTTSVQVYFVRRLFETKNVRSKGGI